MKNSMTRILWFIAGILLILSGCTLLFRPDASLISMAGMIGFVILLSGIFNLTIYFVFHDLMLGAGWQLLDGILGVLVGFMFLGNSVLVASVLPYIFGMWIMFSGLSKLVGGHDRADRGLGVLGIGLVDQAVLLEEASQASLDDLRDRPDRGRRARFIARDLFPALLAVTF